MTIYKAINELTAVRLCVGSSRPLCRRDLCDPFSCCLMLVQYDNGFSRRACVVHVVSEVQPPSSILQLNMKIAVVGRDL